MSALTHLGTVSRAYENAADKYYQIAQDAAEAEAEYRATRAKEVLKYKAAGERVSNVEAETAADADETIKALHMRRLTTAALADAHKAKLAQLREQVAVGRTAVASERAIDQIHAGGWSGAA